MLLLGSVQLSKEKRVRETRKLQRIKIEKVRENVISFIWWLLEVETLPWVSVHVNLMGLIERVYLSLSLFLSLSQICADICRQGMHIG